MTFSRLVFWASTLISAMASCVQEADSTTTGCGAASPYTPGGASHSVKFKQSDGTDRTFLLHIPSNYINTIPAPLIFSFHGRGKNSSEQETLSQFSNEAFNPDAFAVYPQGVKSAWQGAPYAEPGVDDLGFVADMIANLSATFCLDPTRIYAAGKSNGGGFCGTLACDRTLSTKIAAFAPVSGAFYIPLSSGETCDPTTITIPCNASRADIPMLEFHGNADMTISYGGGPQNGECLPSIPHWVRDWALRDGITATKLTTSLYGGNVLEYQYGTGSNFGLVTRYVTKGLGHAWPSTLPNDDNPTGTYFNATPIIMNFFNTYTL